MIELAKLRVIVAGSRYADERDDDFGWLCRLVDETLDEWKARIALLIHGGAVGVDNLASCWASRHGVQTSVYPANWKVLGRAAGPIRNSAMVEHAHADVLLRFPGGAGTADIAAKAERSGIQVVSILGPSGQLRL